MIEFLNVDCMDYMATLPDKAFDLAIVDPPYGIERFKKPSGSTRFKSSKLMQDEGLLWDVKPTDDFFNELFRVSTNQIIFGANNFNLPSSEYFLIWDKEQTVENFSSAEYAWVSSGLKKPAKVFRYSIHLHNHTEKIHPTQKPIKLYSWILKNYAKPGDKILDTHGGSMSSAIACEHMGFDMTICELDKDYFDAGVKRFKEQTMQIDLFKK